MLSALMDRHKGTQQVRGLGVAELGLYSDGIDLRDVCRSSDYGTR